jgi:hypothetical protein
MPADVTDAFLKYESDSHQILPSTKDFSNLLLSSLRKGFQLYSSPLFLLLDAYDEFRNEEDEETERAILCSCLSEISRANIAKIFITTRPHCAIDIYYIVENAEQIELHGNLRDVEQYLHRKMRFLHLSLIMKNLIAETILEANRENPW